MNMSKWERKLGKYAIPNLTLLLILGYAVGYVIMFLDRNQTFFNFLMLDPYKILHGQVWRLVTWLLIPPNESNLFFVLLMLYCCYSIGTLLERTWGTWKYNVFIWGGVGMTVVAAFIGLLVAFLMYGSDQLALVEQMNLVYWRAFGTYYINVSIYIGFAMTYPDSMVRLFFLIPVKMKWLGVLDVVYLGYLLVIGDLFTKLAVVAALLNCLIFWLINFRRMRSPKQVIRYQQFKKKVQEREETARRNGGALHKCCICGRTDKTNPELEFRFCSKCNGNYEYCAEHLFTHIHKQ
ncbi:MAG: hypothetical protein K6E81_05530 [Lachnospiraceae bacterium]|nr:hypothetical protein [Lachnospiraceae bacterium]